MGKVVGIDLGTTNSVVAHYEGKAPRALTLTSGRQLMRSAVGLLSRGGRSNGKSLVGDAAISSWEYAPRDTIVSVKRLMGRIFDDEHVQEVSENFQYEVVPPSDESRNSVRVVMGGEEYSPVDISALLLRQLKEDAEAYLNDKVTHAVITVPAYFNQAQNAATRLAGQRAGLHVIRLLDEPTAAAVAYAQQIEELELDPAQANAPAKTLLVYDLGGGTFDVSILVYSGNIHSQISVEGDMWLGGDNFDQKLVDWAVKEIENETGIDPRDNEAFMVALLKKIQEAKINLSGSPSAEIIVPNSLYDDGGAPIPLFLDIERDQYNEMIGPLIERTHELVSRVEADMGLTDDDIDHVLLAGNATLTPLVQDSVNARFGKEKVVRAQNPKYVVAEGASVVARMLVGHTICPECEHVNEEGAEACARCGQSLEVTGIKCWACGMMNDETAERCIDCGQLLREKDDEPVYEVAERDYGVELIDGSVSVFVKKGESVPTKDPSWHEFATGEGNQRLMLLRVWCGHDLQHATVEDNGDGMAHEDQDLELQGEAVVFLPPELLRGTPIRVSLALDASKVFVPEAGLLRGDELACAVIKDQGSRAVSVLYSLDAKVDNFQMQQLAAQDRRRLEAARQAVVEGLLARRDVDSALQELEDLIGDLLGSDPETDLERKAMGLLGFTGDLLENYNWGLSAEKSHELTRLAADVKEALQRYQDDPTPQRRQTLEDAVEELDRASDPDPLLDTDEPHAQAMLVMVSLRNRVLSYMGDPEYGEKVQEFLLKHEETRGQFASGDVAQAQMGLMMLISDFEEWPPPPDGKCRVPGCDAKVNSGEIRCAEGHSQIIGEECYLPYCDATVNPGEVRCVEGHSQIRKPETGGVDLDYSKMESKGEDA